MSIQTNKSSALRRFIAVMAGAMALAVSAPAWAEPVGLVCDQTGFYGSDGVLYTSHPETRFTVGKTYVLDVDGAVIENMPAFVSDSQIIAAVDEVVAMHGISINRYNMTMELWALPGVDRDEFVSRLADADTAERRLALVNEALRSRKSWRETYQCRVQQRGI